MTDKGMIVENPLELSPLFGPGIFLPKETGDRKFNYRGSGDREILNVIYYDLPKVPPKAYEVLEKIMTAVVWNNHPIAPSDYAVTNAAEVLSANRLAEIIEEFKPLKIIIWTDTWDAPEKELLFYQPGNFLEVPTLRCHALHTVVADPDRKRECWTTIKRFFEM